MKKIENQQSGLHKLQVSPNNHLDAEVKSFIDRNMTVWQNACSGNLHWIFAHLSNRLFLMFAAICCM